MKGMWAYEAGLYNGIPLDDRSALEIITTPRPQPSKPRNRYVYYPNCAEVPESVAVNILRRSFTIAAGVELDSGSAEGVLFAHGGTGGGHSLFLKDGKLHYVYNWLGDRLQKITSSSNITAGRHALSAEFRKTGDDPQTKSAIGTLTLYIDNNAVGSAEIWTQPGFFGLTGDGLAVGRDVASSVSPSDYAAPFEFTGGVIERVAVDVSGEEFKQHAKEVSVWLARD
jgi:arylsulfatase